MRNRCRVRSVTGVGVAMLALVLFPGKSGEGAPDAGAKARGEFNFYAHSTHGSLSRAQAHVDTYQRYLHETHGVPLPPPTPASAPAAPLADHAAQIAQHGAVDAEIAREVSDAIADDIGRIQRHVDRMQEQAKARGDAQALAKLGDVEKQLGIARRAHAALHEHHAGDSIAPATAMDLAEKVNAALRAAHTAHDAVAERLGAAGRP